MANGLQPLAVSRRRRLYSGAATCQIRYHTPGVNLAKVSCRFRLEGIHGVPKNYVLPNENQALRVIDEDLPLVGPAAEVGAGHRALPDPDPNTGRTRDANSNNLLAPPAPYTAA